MATLTRSGPDGRGRVAVAWSLAMFLALATFAGWVSLPRASDAEATVIAVIWLNITMILVALAFEVARRPYSLHLMHLISMFLFLGAASLFQYSRGYLGVPGPIGELRPYILPAVLATTLWLVGYLLAYEFRRLLVAPPKGAFLNRPLTSSRVMMFSGIAMVGLVYLASVGLLGAATRAATELAIEDFSLEARTGAYTSTLYILTTNLARSLPSMALLASLLLLTGDRRRRPTSMYVVVALIGIGTLLVNNPFAAHRMFFTGSLIAFAAPFVLIRFKTAWLLVVGISFGMAILPALGDARHAIEFNDLLTYIQLVSPHEYLATSSDVDSLGMTALCQKWVDQFGHSWGRQILGAVFSFIPRAIWRTKPIGTGATVTGDLGFDFTNLAPPINAEALVDFGLPGTFVFGALFGLILSRIDTIYWAPGRAAVSQGYRIIDMLYPFLLVAITYYTRGDLFGAMTFAGSFVFWILPLGIGMRTTSAVPLEGAASNAQSP